MTEQNYDEISLRELILIIFKHKKLIIFITLITFVFSVIFSFYQLREGKRASIIVAFNHVGIETHHNPDGSKFDPYQIASPYILTDVISSLNLEGKVSPNSIRSLVTMEPMIPDEIMSLKAFALENDGETYTYFPNEYILTLKASAKRGISADLAQRIADQIVASYRLYFNETYMSHEPVTNILVSFKPDDYDYAEVSEVLRKQQALLKDFNQNLNLLDSSFRSKRTGLTFSDLITSIDLVKKVDLNQIDSLISTYKISKNKEQLMMVYNDQISELETQTQKAVAQSEVTKTMLQAIEDSNNAIASTLTNTKDDSKSYFYQLIMETINKDSTASDLEQKIAFYQQEIDTLSSSNIVSDELLNSLTQQVISLQKNSLTDLISWIVLTDDTAEEFYDQHLSNAFYALSPAEIFNDVRLSLNMALGLILGLMIGIFTAFFKAYWTNDSQGGK